MNDQLARSRVAALRELHLTITGLHAHRDLLTTAQAVVDAVVNAVGFGVAALSIARPNGDFRTVAVAGSDAAREHLLNTERPASTYQEEFALAQDWGSLKFVSHEHLPDADQLGWVPDSHGEDRNDAWHPLDALFAPLMSSAGQLIGVLSVDLPHDLRRPSRDQLDLLELLAGQAAIALDNALLTEQLQSQGELFRHAFDLAAGGMALVSVNGKLLGRFQRVNPALCDLLGRNAKDLLAVGPSDITHPDDRLADQSMIADLLTGASKTYRREKRCLKPDGAYVWVAVTATVNRDPGGIPLCVVSQVEDITGRRAEHQRLHYLARHDTLTNLPNRAAVEEHLLKAIGVAEHTGRPGAVLYLDLDRFKSINDEHGHHVGDHVLAVFADRIRVSLRPGDFVGRVGGDEFIIVADNLDLLEAHQMARRVREMISAAMTYQGITMAITISIGISAIAPVGANHEDILRNADRAMYEQKSARYRPTAITPS